MKAECMLAQRASRQEHEAAGHSKSAVGKQVEADAGGSVLDFPFSPQSGGMTPSTFIPQLNSADPLVGMARDVSPWRS